MLALKARGARFELCDDGWFHVDLDRVHFEGLPAPATIAKMLAGLRDEIYALLQAQQVH
jgi:hypothetical protein